MTRISEQEWKDLKEKERILQRAAEILRVEEKDLPRVVQRFLNEIDEMENQLKKLNANAP